MRYYVWVMGILLCASLGFAQVKELPVKFNGQVRVRSEADGRDFNSDTSINTFTLLRVRFGALVQPQEDVNVYVQFQDSRAFGQEPNTLAHTFNLDIHQAYVEIKNLWNRPISLKVGRQEMVYGSERIIGAVGWSNVGRAFDGVKWTFGRKNTLDVFAMLLNESDTPVAGAATPTTVAGKKETGNYFYGVYYKHRRRSDYRLDVYGLFELNLNETVPGEDDLRRFTFGSYNKGKFSQAWNFESEFALQVGKRRGQDVLAFMLTGTVGYTFPTSRKPGVLIGYDFLSGMNAGDEDYKVFDTLFATNHKFYGFMDYFINIPVNTGGRGLQDFMIKTKVPLSDKWAFNAHFHNFRAAKGDEKDFGNELDLTLNYKYNRVARFIFGLSFFAPGDLMKAAFASDDVAVWSYSTLQVTF